MDIGMWPKGFEQLSFHDQVFLFRINLRCTALMLLVSVFIMLNSGWEAQVIGVLASAGLAALADQAERVLRRLDTVIGVGELRHGADRNHLLRHDQRVKRGETTDSQRSAGSQ